jgi:hypothetical protein
VRYRTRARTAYLAGRFERREELIAAETVLKEHNILPGSRWLHKESDMRKIDDAHREEWATKDIEDVLNADMVIFFSEDLTRPWKYGEGDCVFATEDEEPDGTPHLFVPAIWARGGRHVEYGVALAQGISIAVIGPKENLFHYYPREFPSTEERQVQHFATLDEFIAFYDENNAMPEDAEMPVNEERPG